MRRTKSISMQNYSLLTNFKVEAFSVIKDILYNASNSTITLIYEYDDINTELNKTIEVSIIRETFNESTYRYTYWGTSVEHKAVLSTIANTNYGNSGTNISLNVINEVHNNYIFYNELKPLEETRDLKIEGIIN